MDVEWNFDLIRVTDAHGTDQKLEPVHKKILAACFARVHEIPAFQWTLSAETLGKDESIILLSAGSSEPEFWMTHTLQGEKQGGPAHPVISLIAGTTILSRHMDEFRHRADPTDEFFPVQFKGPQVANAFSIVSAAIGRYHAAQEDDLTNHSL